MGKYIHKFDTVSEFNDYRNENYEQPWLSYTTENDNVDYNWYTPEEYELRTVPFTIKALGSGDITWTLTDGKTVTYSKNGSEYQTWDGTTAINVSEGDMVSFIANNDNYNENIITSTANYEVLGNLYSIISEDFLNEQPYTERVFRRLFYGSETLLYSDKLILSRIQTSRACYQGMFRDCINLKTAPKLEALNAAYTCYNTMFMGCSSLIEAPELPATTLGQSCYNSMFCDCTSLTKAPEILPATNVPTMAYQVMFSGTAITKAPKILATTLGPSACKAMLQHCTNLKIACTSFAPVTVDTDSCYAMFNGCTSLVEGPAILPATTLAEQCYMAMFQHCESLIKAPMLPATTLANGCYRSMFIGCHSLVTVPELPATTLESNCYQHMFALCTSLTTAPVLPATTLVTYCYKYMFADCTNLNHVTCLATDISATECTYNWFEGASSIGTFEKAAGMSDWTTSISGIPEGWTVEIATE